MIHFGRSCQIQTPFRFQYIGTLQANISLGQQGLKASMYLFVIPTKCTI